MSGILCVIVKNARCVTTNTTRIRPYYHHHHQQQQLFVLVYHCDRYVCVCVCVYVCRRRFLLTPWSRVLLETFSGSQLVKKFPTFYGTRRFITAFTRACQLSLSWARSIQSMSPSYFLKIHL